MHSTQWVQRICLWRKIEAKGLVQNYILLLFYQSEISQNPTFEWHDKSKIFFLYSETRWIRLRPWGALLWRYWWFNFALLRKIWSWEKPLGANRELKYSQVHLHCTYIQLINHYYWRSWLAQAEGSLMWDLFTSVKSMDFGGLEGLYSPGRRGNYF